MSDSSFILYADQVVSINLGDDGATLTNAGSATISYADSEAGARSAPQGTIAPAASVDLAGTQFLRAAARTELKVEALPSQSVGSSSVPDPTAAGQMPVSTAAGPDGWDLTDAIVASEALPNPDTEVGSAGAGGTYADGLHSHARSGLYDGFGIDEVNVVAVSGSSEAIPDTSLAQVSFVMLTANCALTFPEAETGKRFDLYLKQDATGSRVPTFPASVGWPGGSPPTWSTTAGLTDHARFRCVDGSRWMAEVVALGIVTPPAALSIVQSIDLAVTSTTQVTFPVNITPGNAILLVAANNGSSLNPSGGGVTWQQIGAHSDLVQVGAGAVPVNPEVWLGTASTGGPGTATITFDGATFIGHFFEIAGAALRSGSVSVGSQAATSDMSPYVTPTVVAANAGDMPWVVVASNINSGQAGFGAPSAPWTGVQPQNTRDGVYPAVVLRIAYQASTTAGGSYSSSWTPNATDIHPWSSISFLLRPV